MSDLAKAGNPLSALIVLAILSGTPVNTTQAEGAVKIEPPKLDAAVRGNIRSHTAIVAGGCFWGIQAVYQHTKGVLKAESGYAGGSERDANYTAVSSGHSGHAEAVQVTFDPRVISYGKILQIFFSVAHNPTELDYQGPDHGPQYRSEIFPLNIQQRKIAEDYVAQLSAARAFPKPIVTKVDSAEAKFYLAEPLHQDYVAKHPSDPYVVANDAPKLENLKLMFPDLYRERPVLASDPPSTSD